MFQKGFAPLYILIGLVVLVGIAVGINYLGTQNNKIASLKNQLIQLSVTPTPYWKDSQVSATPSGEITDSAKAEWKTYTNKKYNFTFQYPANWLLKEENDLSVSIISPEDLFVRFETNIFGVGGRCTVEPNSDLGHETIQFISKDVNLYYSGDKTKNTISDAYIGNYSKEHNPCPNIAFFDIEQVGGLNGTAGRGGLESLALGYKDKSVNAAEFKTSTDFATFNEILSTFKSL